MGRVRGLAPRRQSPQHFTAGPPAQRSRGGANRALRLGWEEDRASRLLLLLPLLLLLLPRLRLGLQPRLLAVDLRLCLRDMLRISAPWPMLALGS